MCVSYLRHSVEEGVDVEYRFVELHRTLVDADLEGFITFEHTYVPSTTHTNTQDYICVLNMSSNPWRHTHTQAMRRAFSILILDNTSLGYSTMHTLTG